MIDTLIWADQFSQDKLQSSEAYYRGMLMAEIKKEKFCGGFKFLVKTFFPSEKLKPPFSYEVKDNGEEAKRFIEKKLVKFFKKLQ